MSRLFHALPIIEDVLAGRYPAPELGGPLRAPIRTIAVADSLEGAERDLVTELGLGQRLAVVADENTWTAMGDRVAAALPGADTIVLDHPKADEATAEHLQERARHADALVAVGSGTLNDLCKYVTHRTGRRSAVFATAPSMDGYVTTTVSITRGGFKLSLPAHAPVGVFFDLSVLAAAPPRMMRAGLGDTVCRTTAQVDWLLSHLLLDTVYAETPYRLMDEDEPLLYAQAHRLPEGDLGAMLLLTRMLILSGLGVLVTHTSHCGSMGEHAISHFIDTFADPHPRTLHGEQVGIATWTMARLQTALLAAPEPPVLPPAARPARFERDYGRFAAAASTRSAGSLSMPPEPSGSTAASGALARHARSPALGHAAAGRDCARDACRRSVVDRRRPGRGLRPLPARRRRGARVARPLLLPRPRRSGGRLAGFAARRDEPSGPRADEERSPLSTVLDLLSADEQRRTRIAWLYYVEGMTQAQIADRLAVSRVKVVRDLQIGRQTGLVQIQISGRLASCVALERALERRFGLEQAVVVPTPDDPGHLPATLGVALGSWLSDRLRPGQTIGVGWGRTLHWSVRALRRRDVPG